MIWPLNVHGYLSTLLEFGRFEQVKELAQKALKVAGHENSEIVSTSIRRPLALAHAWLNDFETAVENAQITIDVYESMNVSGVLLGNAYETRARVAIMMKDQDNFHTYAKLCSEQYRVGHNPSLTAKYEKLIREATGASLSVSIGLAGYLNNFGQQDSAVAKMIATLNSFDDPQQMIQHALDLIMQQGGWLMGLLYLIQGKRPALVAIHGNIQPSCEIDSFAVDYLSAELDESDNVTVTQADMAENPMTFGTWTASKGQRFVPFLLFHDSEEGMTVTGMVVVHVESTEQIKIPFKLLNVLSRALKEIGCSVKDNQETRKIS